VNQNEIPANGLEIRAGTAKIEVHSLKQCNSSGVGFAEEGFVDPVQHW